MKQRIINPWSWQDHMGYSQAIEITSGQHVLYCAGQASVDANGNPVHAGDMRAQLNQALDNLGTVLAAAGYHFANVVRLNIYTPDVDQYFAHADVVMRRLAPADCRASATLLGVTRLAFPQLLVELEATAVR